MRTFLGFSILLMFWPQTATENKPAVSSGSPVGLTFEAFMKQYPSSARCFFGDDKKPETLEFCFVEPTKDDEILLFGKFPVTKEMVTFKDGKVGEVTATLDEKITNVTKFLDEVSPKPDLIKDCQENADEIAKHEAEFHTHGLSGADKVHYESEIRESARAYYSLHCEDISAKSITSWKYRGEEIVVSANPPGWAPKKKEPEPTQQQQEIDAIRKKLGLPAVEQIENSNVTVIKMTPLPWWLDRDRSSFSSPAQK